MNKEMENEIEKSINSLEVMHKEWFYQFFDMLKKCEVDNSFIEKALELILSENNRYSGSIGTINIFINNNKAKSNIDNFFDYLDKMFQKMGYNKFKEFLEKTIMNIERDFENHKSVNHAMKTNFFNLFLRELILENPQDVNIEFLELQDAGRLDVKLDKISLGHIEYEETLANRKLIMFSDMRTLPGLERMGLGSYMFYMLCSKIANEKPGYALMAWGVMKGRDGEKAYSKWGGYPTFPEYGDNGWEFVEHKLTQEEYNEAPKIIAYYFPENIIEENSKKTNKIYGLQKQ